MLGANTMLLNTTMIKNTHHGWGSLSQLAELIAPFNVRNILLITDPFLTQNGVVEQVKESLPEYDLTLFDEIEAEPTLMLAEELVSFVKAQRAELIIGLGGGSALDLAKLAAVLASHEGAVREYLNLSGDREINKKGLPTVLIPTTSGTGSEVTDLSVLSLEGSKDVVAHHYLLADCVLIDPKLTLTVPPRVTAATGVDALTHAIESYLSINADPITDSLALYAIRLISRSLQLAVEDGNNRAARTDLSYGSYLAGLSFFNAGVAGVHALAYPLGGQFKISHGESNALLLPHVMEYIRSSSAERLRDIYGAMGFDIAKLDADSASQYAIRAIRELVEAVGIPSSLQAYGIKESALESLTEDALKQTRLLARSPMPLQREDILKIYQIAWQGSSKV